MRINAVLFGVHDTLFYLENPVSNEEMSDYLSVRVTGSLHSTLKLLTCSYYL